METAGDPTYNSPGANPHRLAAYSLHLNSEAQKMVGQSTDILEISAIDGSGRPVLLCTPAYCTNLWAKDSAAGNAETYHVSYFTPLVGIYDG